MFRTDRLISVSRYNDLHLLEEVDHLKFVFLPRHLGLDFRICVVDDCQEHVEKYEKNEENVQNEVRRAEDAVCLLQLGKLEISKQNAEL